MTVEICFLPLRCSCAQVSLQQRPAAAAEPRRERVFTSLGGFERGGIDGDCFAFWRRGVFCAEGAATGHRSMSVSLPDLIRAIRGQIPEEKCNLLEELVQRLQRRGYA